MVGTMHRPIGFLRIESVGIARDSQGVQGLPKIFGLPPIKSGTGKATDFKFCTHINKVDRNKSP